MSCQLYPCRFKGAWRKKRGKEKMTDIVSHESFVGRGGTCACVARPETTQKEIKKGQRVCLQHPVSSRGGMGVRKEKRGIWNPCSTVMPEWKIPAFDFNRWTGKSSQKGGGGGNGPFREKLLQISFSGEKKES